MESKKNITLIWNDVEDSEYYNIYRDGLLIASEKGNSFVDKVKRGKKYCYEISCIDQYKIESNKSNLFCKTLNTPSFKRSVVGLEGRFFGG